MKIETLRTSVHDLPVYSYVACIFDSVNFYLELFWALIKMLTKNFQAVMQPMLHSGKGWEITGEKNNWL